MQLLLHNLANGRFALEGFMAMLVNSNNNANAFDMPLVSLFTYLNKSHPCCTVEAFSDSLFHFSITV